MKSKSGGNYARKGEGKLWEYTTNNDGSFISPEAQNVSRLYFPLINRYGMKCSVTPELKGDICSDFHHYHTIPVVTEDLHRVNNSRNFWVYVEGKEPWSITGVGANSKKNKWQSNEEETTVKGEIGLFHLEKINKNLALKATSTVYVPPVNEFVEVTKVELENIGSAPVEIHPTAAVPIYGRTPDNLRDHRNVTTMFIKNKKTEHGVIIKPIINFNEFGHSNNKTCYSVLGYDENGAAPKSVVSTVKEFIGEGGSFDAPEMIYKNLDKPAVDYLQTDGFEAIGALKFSPASLHPGEKKSYIILNGITGNEADIANWKQQFGSLEKANEKAKETREYWQKIVNTVAFKSENTDFDNWVRWINFQLICRQVYGNSYLPDFGYGRGGRGWRDLFSDLISIFMIDPEIAKNEIVNNFKGIRMDGTNATIVGTKPGEFVADRNNVPRTWSDHGSWPFFVLNFYIQQTGDYNILLKEMEYWKDQFIYRSKKINENWDISKGTLQLDEEGNVYKASILEHTLLQQLCSFFNVGKHNNILLEGADWNDTYDMARNKGESVCFFNWYAHNLKTIGEVLEYLRNEKGIKSISLLKEMLCLFDTLPNQTRVDYESPIDKKEHLMNYYATVSDTVSGEKTEVDINAVITDLKAKSDWIYKHIRDQEWLTTKDGLSFFNGHYDDDENRVHGDHPKGVRIDLTSQVLPIIFETATEKHIPEMHKSIMTYLKGPNGGLHLCSNFHEDKMYFGRLTGFVFGHKEHGGIWMQQNAMLIYGLYRRGFVQEAYDLLNEVFHLCNDSATAKMFPGIPSYFELDGRGSYFYLTGSATWLMLALVTQMYGIRGEHGNLVIHPKLTKDQFKDKKNSMSCTFQGKNLEVTFINTKLTNWCEYSVDGITLNGNKLSYTKELDAKCIISKSTVLQEFSADRINKLEVRLN